MKTSDFDYELPEHLIAQTPVEPRDHSRLMVVHCDTGAREDKHFYEVIDYLNPGDALVINETKVIPARLLGVKEETGVPVEILLLRRKNQTDWEALVRPGRRLKPGTSCIFGDGLLKCEIMDSVQEIGGRIVRFHYDGVFEEILDKLGEMRRTSTRSWRIRAVIRRYTQKMRALRRHRQPDCTLRLNCSKKSDRRVL